MITLAAASSRCSSSLGLISNLTFGWFLPTKGHRRALRSAYFSSLRWVGFPPTHDRKTLDAHARLLLSLLLIFLYSNCSFLWFCGVARLLPSLLLTHIIVPRLLLLLLYCCCSCYRSLSLLRLLSSRCTFWLLHSLLLLSSLVLRSIAAAVLLCGCSISLKTR